tara:strand:- start:606 stop:869 length:264 start_codon:yes stop_codon:yes gene_type:complete
MNIQDIKRLATEGKSPYFFNKDTMDFFNSKVYKYIKEVKEGYLFITSEVFGDSPRHYQIRLISLDGSIESLLKVDSLELARQYLRAY